MPVGGKYTAGGRPAMESRSKAASKVSHVNTKLRPRTQVDSNGHFGTVAKRPSP